ncbi:MAG: TIGR03619 family F420-dependent LLM class oxidoreductase [Alphaproteobacteria bacterium]|nr:TIGR03619 family F420-dependent LLM class oxidoreductase [Alphaproteobacteria bacterium]
MRIGISLPVRELQDDIGAIKAFAQAAEALGFTHLRVPEQIIRPGSGPLHEPLVMMALIAGVTDKIELVPSVLVLPARQTVLVAKQTATLDVLSGGRLRLGIGVGKDEVEYASLGADFHNRGARAEEQIALLRRLWTEASVTFEGRWDRGSGAGLDPLPVQRPIPIWIGASALPVARIRRRIGRQADGWFVLCAPDEFPAIRDDIRREAEAAGRDPAAIGAEAGVAVVGPREHEWQARVAGWREIGLTHLCLRTLGGGLTADQHIERMRRAAAELPTV